MPECKAIKNCAYWYQAPGEDYPSCHYPSWTHWPAPCEYDEPEYDEDENDIPDEYTLDDLGPNWY